MNGGAGMVRGGAFVIRKGVGRWLGRHWHLAGGCLLLAYFIYHGIEGPRGLLAWTEKERELTVMRAELAGIDAQIETLSIKVAALQPDRVDPDMLEEQLRELGFIDRGEVIILPTGEKTGAR